MSVFKAVFMAKTIEKYKYNKYNKNQQTKKVILHKIWLTHDTNSKKKSSKITLNNSLSELSS